MYSCYRPWPAPCVLPSYAPGPPGPAGPPGPTGAAGAGTQTTLFQAVQGDDQSYSGAESIVLFDTVVYDTAGTYAGTSYTIPVSGY